MITVDLTTAIPAGLLAYPHMVSLIVRDIAEAARAEIVRLANEKLGSSTEDYVQGIQPVKYHFNGVIPPGDHTVATITLVGVVPNQIEQGMAPYDMKPFLLSGRNAKITKKGVRYNTVPFRHGTPGTTGRNMTPMGAAHERREVVRPGGHVEVIGTMSKKESDRLGKLVHRKAKALSPTTSHPNNGTQWGERLKAGLAPKLKAHHKTDIYAGMVREAKTYRVATQNKYTTFRRVSDNSDPQAWLHPGIEAKHIFRDASPYVEKISKFLFEQAAEEIAKHGR